MSLRFLTLLFVTMISLFADKTLQKVHELGNATSLLFYKTMLGEVKKQLDSKPTHEVIHFCSKNAQGVREKLKTLMPKGVEVRRVSDRIRNKKNIAIKKDLEIINYFKELKEDGKNLKREVKIVEEEKNYIFYKPLLISQKCTLCHGAKDTLKKEVVSTLKKLYPEDKATGYIQGDLRGLVIVTIDKMSL